VADIELRTSRALMLVAEAYEEGFGSVSSVLGGIEDPAQRSQASAWLGVREDGVADATQWALRSAAGPSSPGKDTKQRDQARLELAQVAAEVGAELAAAVQADDPAAALTAAKRFDGRLREGQRAGLFTAEDATSQAGVLEAAYAPIGGSLRGGVATLENSDKLFERLGLHSTGAALRREGDDRSDEALDAEYRFDEAMNILFESVAQRDGQKMAQITTDAKTIHTTLKAESPTVAAFPTYLDTRYRHLHGIGLRTHIDLSELTDSESRDTLAGLGLPSESRPERPDDIDVVRPDFFEIDKTVPPGIDADAVTDADMIHRMTALHVRHLQSLTQDIYGAAGMKALRLYLADLRFAGAYEWVCSTFAAKTGTTVEFWIKQAEAKGCLLYTSPSPRDRTRSRMPSSA